MKYILLFILKVVKHLLIGTLFMFLQLANLLWEFKLLDYRYKEAVEDLSETLRGNNDTRTGFKKTHVPTEELEEHGY